MKNEFHPVLLGSEIHTDYLNPGDTLFITLRMRNSGQSFASEPYRFVVDLTYGHQRTLENKQYNYRSTAHAFPDVMMWSPGMETEVTLRWEAVTAWSGTYHLTLRILSSDDTPIFFSVPGHGEVSFFRLGFVNISWNLGRPWVAMNARSVITEYGDICPAASNVNNVPMKNHMTPCSDNIILAGDITVMLSRYEPQLISINEDLFRYATPEVHIKHLLSGHCYASGLDRCCSVKYSLIKHTEEKAVYTADVFYENIIAASFSMRLILDGRILSVTVDKRNESKDFELLSVKYPSLVEMDNGYLLDFFGGGRLIPINESLPIYYEKQYDVRNAAVLYNEECMFIVESTHLDSTLTTGVYSVNKQKYGFIGAGIICRIPAEASLSGIPIKNPPIFTIELCDTADVQPDWTTAACLLRRSIKPNNSRALYRDAYVYKQLSTWGPLPDESFRYTDTNSLTQNLFRTVTFKEIAETVRQFAHLTDHAKQVVYVTGFQKGGFDSAYPYPFETETRCGSLEDLRDCLKDIRKYNASSGLHDNFDDISTIHINEFPYTALDECGEPWHGWVWAAGPTYMTAFCRYVESGEMEKRVKTMNELLPLKDTYHIDVLTAETARYDFNPAHQASAEDSYQAKMEIVKEWNKYGIDITSELLTHPSVGYIGFALHTRFEPKEKYIPGEKFVPLVPMIYHGIIGYTAPSRTVEDMLWGLLIGGQTFYEEDITGDLCVSRFYIQNIPAMKLYDKTMISYTRDGNYARTEYSDNSYVSVDFEKAVYRVVVDGLLIGQDFTTFVQASKPGAYLAYSFYDKQVIYPKPMSLNSNTILKAVILTTEGEREAAASVVQLEGDRILLHLPPMTPVKIYETVES